MADTFTTHYNLTKPQVGGDPDTWGGLLNTNFDTIDSQLYTASTYALPLTGGTLTGQLNVNTTNGTGSITVTDTGTSGANIHLLGSGGTTPGKYIRAAGGNLDIVNSGYTNVLASFSDGGNLTLTGGVTTSTASTLGGAVTFNSADNTFTNTAPLRFTGMGATGSIFIHGLNGAGDDILNIARNNANSNYTLNLNGNFTTTGTIYSNSSSTSAITVNGGNLRIIGSSTSKFLRTNPSTSALEILNNAYTSVISSLDDTGHWTATDFTATSDARLKTNVQRLRRGLDELKQMLPREYIKAGREEVGFLAQEVREVLPEAVYEDEKGILSVSYGQLVALLAAAVLDIDRRLQTEGI